MMATPSIQKFEMIILMETAHWFTLFEQAMKLSSIVCLNKVIFILHRFIKELISNGTTNY